MSRKTFDVNKLVEKANTILSKGSTKDERQGIILLVESILHETGNYKGFNYLKTSDVPDGELPGIHTNSDGSLPTDIDPFDNTDHTRIYFYIS